MAAKPYTKEELEERAQRLLSDVEKLSTGWRPSASDLDNAPFLDAWQVFSDGNGGVYLGGECTGHPRIRDGYITTSCVVAADLDAGWVRTASRFFRVGQSLVDVLNASNSNGMRH